MKKILFVFTLSLILAATGYVFSAGYYGTTSGGSTEGLTLGTNATLTVADSVAANITAPFGSGAFTSTYDGTGVNITATTANITTLTAGTANITGITVANVINASGTLTAVPSATAPIMFGNTTAVNTSTGATFPTAVKTQISKASAFTNAAVGDLIIVTGGTGATTGQYRLTTKTSNDLVVVDRNIHASGTDITDGAFSVYKDIISVSPTDATNGQLITAYSHTNKPLQIGGTTLLATAGHSLTNRDVLFGGKSVFKDEVFFDSAVKMASDIVWSGNASFRIGVDDGLKIAVVNDDGKTNNNVIITGANYVKDHDHETPSTNPTLFIHSNTDPDSDNTQWMSFTHDVTDGVIDTGTGLVKIKEDSANASETASSGGGFARRIAEATSGTLSGATGTIAVNVPTGARILGVQLRVDTAVTFSGTDTTWKAVYVNTPTTAICSTQAAAKSTKYSALHAAYEITTGTVTITVSSDGSDTFTGGVIRAIVYYEDTIAMSDAP
jgi:hypothetical protein